MVWGLRLIAGSEGPSLISLAASHLPLLSVYFAAHVVFQFDGPAAKGTFSASSIRKIELDLFDLVLDHLWSLMDEKERNGELRQIEAS